ncbi:MAG: hypothetical protein A2539_04595 [Elusimicrobia bacterium RIFOXYD2_FULL_34_15]|nr:MAG: hypothetical protein A2539_04595 [Elusimicrobia bacterium RIFOXYD2_FULL_34_15]
MKFTIICDESGTENRHLVIGALVIPRINHTLLIEEMKTLKKELHLRWEGEIKWGKVSKKYIEKYKKITEWFFNHLKSNHLKFRAHVIDTAKKEYREYGEGDKENSFYKVFFHLLMQCIKRLAIEEEGSNVLILLDDKKNRYPFRLPLLKKTLNKALKRDLKLHEIVANVEPRHSSGNRVEGLIQIVDVLIGAIGYVRNESCKLPNASPAKVEMIGFLENLIGTKFEYDTNAGALFNIWTFDVTVPLEKKKYYKKNRPIT